MSYIPPVSYMINNKKEYVKSNNNEIVSIKEIGKNLKITHINNVNKYDIDKCINIICKNNPNVKFNNIVYDKDEKKIYFYTDKVISIKEYTESKINKNKQLRNNKEILEEIKKIFSQKNFSNAECLSLYDISKLVSNYEYEYNNLKKHYTDYFNKVLKYRFPGSKIIIQDFDYKNKQLKILYKYFSDYNKIVFKKENGDLYISESKSSYAQKIQMLFGKNLSELYDKFMLFNDYRSEFKHVVDPVNSNFKVNINYNGVSIFSGVEPYSFLSDFSLKSNLSGYNYDCNSTNIVNTLKGKENKLFKKIFAKIEDCPKWCQKDLYYIKQNQLAEEKKKLQEKEEKERQQKEDMVIKRRKHLTKVVRKNWRKMNKK